MFGTSIRVNFTDMSPSIGSSLRRSTRDGTVGRPLSCPSTLPDVRRATRSTHTGSQSTCAAFIDFPVVVQCEVPTIQTVQKSGEIPQCQHIDRYRRARRETETGHEQPENPEDGREDTGPSAQRHVPIIQKFQMIAETPQVVQRECRSSGRSRRLLRHHRNSCGRLPGSSSSRRWLSTRQVLVIQSPEDGVVRQVQDMDMIVDHGYVRRFPTCVTTPSTDNPDDAATTEVSQSQ